MPSLKLACSKCKRPRHQGGKSKADGLCRLCFHAAKRAETPKAIYTCTAGCGLTVSKPDRMCPSCAGERRQHRAGQGITIKAPTVKELAARAPSSSWWATPEYQHDRDQAVKILAEQLPRLQSVNMKVPEANRDAFEASI